MKSKARTLAGVAAALTLVTLLAGCGSDTDPGDRTLGGAAVGAGTGAAVGALFGGVGIVPGTVIGAAAGGATGAVTEDEQVDLGDPVWKK